MSTAEEAVTLDNGGFTALELNSRTLNSKNTFLKKNGTRCAVGHKNTHTHSWQTPEMCTVVICVICVCPGLLLDQVQVVYTTPTRTSATTIMELC